MPVGPSLEELRKCVHCGICLPQCPTYRVLGEEMDSPRGRIYLMRAHAEGRAELTETFARHMDLCLGCRACETACPSGVAFGSLIEATRAQLRGDTAHAREGWLERLIFAVFPHPDRLGRLLGALRGYQRSGLRAVVARSGLLKPFPGLAGLEALLPEIPGAAPIPEFTPARGPRRGRVGMVTGCVQRHLFPDVNADTARLLALAGYEVVAPRRQGCCGALDLHAGRIEAFCERASALAAAFPADLGLDLIVTNAAGCGSTLRAYGHWLPDSRDAMRLAERTRDVSEVLADSELPLGPLDVTVTYHDACHLAHGQRVRSQPRALLARIPGLRLVELLDSDLCCGSAGVYNLLEPEMADRLLAMKIDRIAETGARIVAAGNPGCALQIARGARQRGLDLEVRHPVELLARSVAAARRTPKDCSETTRGADMKIRVRDHIALQADKMAKIALAATPRALLDLYCLAPGQSQKPHTHGDQDKIYLVLEGRGRIHLDGQEEAVAPGEVVVAKAGAAHGVVNDGTDPLVLLVVVTPPPPHA